MFVYSKCSPLTGTRLVNLNLFLNVLCGGVSQKLKPFRHFIIFENFILRFSTSVQISVA